LASENLTEAAKVVDQTEGLQRQNDARNKKKLGLNALFSPGGKENKALRQCNLQKPFQSNLF